MSRCPAYPLITAVARGACDEMPVDARYELAEAFRSAAAVSRNIERRPDSIVGLEPVMHIRPQSLATSVDVGEPSPCTAPVETHPAPDPLAADADGAWKIHMRYR
jgi:hypothetical protein